MIDLVLTETHGNTSQIMALYKCTTTVTDYNTGEQVEKPKKAYDTLDDAIAACKAINTKPNRIHKVVSYKCKSCHKYHIGRNGKELTDKYVSKLKKGKRIKDIVEQRNVKKTPTFKIVGKIDLDKIPKK
jgi:hypothetical protein